MKDGEFQLPECPRGSGLSLDRCVKRRATELGCGQWRHLDARPQGDECQCPLLVQVLPTWFSRALLGGGGVECRPSLLQVLAATAGADHFTDHFTHHLVHNSNAELDKPANWWPLIGDKSPFHSLSLPKPPLRCQ